MIKKIENPQTKSKTCDALLRALPNWFGLPQAILDYVDDVQSMDTWVYQENNKDIGFISIRKHNPYTAEIHVMAVLEKHHNQGIGKTLLATAEDFLANEKYKYLSVKTLSAGREDQYYFNTRHFYLKTGFTPIEEFKTLWGDGNPCLMLIKNVERPIAGEKL